MLPELDALAGRQAVVRAARGEEYDPMTGELVQTSSSSSSSSSSADHSRFSEESLVGSTREFTLETETGRSSKLSKWSSQT